MKHPLYSTWVQMRFRCTSPKSEIYEYYGGRGISVCERWNDFDLFVEDMGERPDGYSLDRIDVNGNYCPENCRWADRATQRANSRPHRPHRLQPCTGDMRHIREFRPGQWQVTKRINGRRIWTTFRSLDAAKDFRSTLEMECEMNRRLHGCAS